LPTIITHSVVAASSAWGFGSGKETLKFWILSIACSLLADADVVAHPNFTLEVLFTQEEEIRRDDGRGSRRNRYWSIADRRLLAVVDRQMLKLPKDYLYFLPQALPERFTVRELAEALGQPYFKAGQMAYCLRHMGAIEVVGKRSSAILYYANPLMP